MIWNLVFSTKKMLTNFISRFTGFGLSSSAEIQADTLIQDQSVSKQVTAAEYKAAKLDVGQTVFTMASPLKDIQVADWISTEVIACKDVKLGTMIYYVYEGSGIVKRVFKIREAQVKAILKCKKDSYYLTDVPFSATDADLSKVKSLTNERLELLLTHSAAPKPKSTTLNEVQKSTPKADVPMQMKQPQNAQQAKPQPARQPLRDAVNRKAQGDETVGVIASFGTVTRSKGETTYESFELALDSDGLIARFYGVDLEREVRDRGVKAGDTIKLISMGRQLLTQSYKNLFAIEVLKKGA